MFCLSCIFKIALLFGLVFIVEKLCAIETPEKQTTVSLGQLIDELQQQEMQSMVCEENFDEEIVVVIDEPTLQCVETQII